MSLFQEILKNKKNSFFLIAGPCVVESYDNASYIAQVLKELCSKINIPFVFKASYRKANRSKSSSFAGLGDEIALKILDDIKRNFDLPICTDFHSAQEAEMAAQVADIIQIPAFLCRQTDILYAAGKTEKIVNIKKGQFLSPEAMGFATEKVAETGNKKIMLTERGTSFGYTDLIVDFRGIPSMKSFGYPVVLDVTHSLQQPNQISGVSGGRPEMIATIAKAGIAAGVNGIFLETHPEPSKALSDGANMLQLDKVEKLIVDLLRIYQAV